MHSTCWTWCKSSSNLTHHNLHFCKFIYVAVSGPCICQCFASSIAFPTPGFILFLPFRYIRKIAIYCILFFPILQLSPYRKEACTLSPYRKEVCTVSIVSSFLDCLHPPWNLISSKKMIYTKNAGNDFEQFSFRHFITSIFSCTPYKESLSFTDLQDM